MKVYGFECEWDIGYYATLWLDEAKLLTTLEADPNLQEIMETEGFTFGDLINGGLLSVKEYTVIT